MRLRDRWHATVGGLSPVYWAIWWGLLVNRLATFVGTFLALYLVQERGFDEAQAGLVMALFGLGCTVGSPIGGVLADRLGRRATMLLGLGTGAVTVYAIALTRWPPALVALAFLAGACGQIYFPASGAAVADVVPSADRPRAFGLQYWAVNLGLAIGFAVAGAVARHGVRPLLLADATTTLLCAMVVAARVPETRPAGLVHEPALAGIGRVLRDGHYLAFLGLHLAALVVFTQFQLALPLDMAAHGVGASGFSLLMACNCAGVVVLQPWLAPALRRFDGGRLLAAMTLLFAVGYGLNAFAATLPLYLAGAACWTVGEVVGFPVAAALVADLSPPELRGRYQGAFSMVWGLAMTLSPAIGGTVLQRLGSRPLWLGCLAAGAVIAVGQLAAGRSRRPRLAALAAAERAGGPPDRADIAP